MRIPPIPFALGIAGLTAGGYYAIDNLAPDSAKPTLRTLGLVIDAGLLAGYGGAAALTALGARSPGGFAAWSRLPSEVTSMSRGITCAVVAPSILAGLALAFANDDV